MNGLPPPRLAILVLVRPDGRLVGALPAIPVPTPWWQDAAPLVDAARARFGIDVTILRLLETERNDEAHGGLITYLAETPDDIATSPWPHALDDHPLRLPYAKPGGPQADLDWAIRELLSKGIELTGRPQQIRTWNLSSIWKLPASRGDVWLKSVPPFFAHEGKLLATLQGEHVPKPISADTGRTLLPDIAGNDLHEATLDQRLEMISLLTGLQARWAVRIDELKQLGLPDWCGQSLTRAIEDVLARTAGALTPKDARILLMFADALPDRFRALEACGIADTLVHGDFHSGNVRGQGTDLTLIDWGDSGIGHPLLDQPAFLRPLPSELHAPLNSHWNAHMRELWPGSSPERAAELIAPIAAARQAVIYRKFLDNIEPSEQVYHRNDPAQWLKRTLEILEREA
jgi:Ser/Thr protein kinase RdoA (MazF antagonist)